MIFSHVIVSNISETHDIPVRNKTVYTYCPNNASYHLWESEETEDEGWVEHELYIPALWLCKNEMQVHYPYSY